MDGQSNKRVAVEKIYTVGPSSASDARELESMRCDAPGEDAASSGAASYGCDVLDACASVLHVGGAGRYASGGDTADSSSASDSRELKGERRDAPGGGAASSSVASVGCDM